jgi:predicted phage tail protein
MNMMIATNDDAAGRGWCSEINATTTAAARGLAAGTYSVCVSAFAGMGGATPIASYLTTITIGM